MSLIALSYVAYRCFCKKITDETEYLASENEQGQKEVKKLVDQGNFDATWLKYLETACDIEKPEKTSLDSQCIWNYLPPQNLIENLLINCDSSDDVLELVPPRFLRDCLLAYPELFGYIYYTCFRGHPEYLTDICIKYPAIANDTLFYTQHGPSKVNFEPDLCLEIFNSAYPLIKQLLDEKKTYFVSIKSLTSFLLDYYHRPIHKDIFDKIKNLECSIDQLESQEPSQKEAKQAHILINLVIAKLNHQGIYDDKWQRLEDTTIKLEEKFLSRLSNSDQINDLIEELCT